MKNGITGYKNVRQARINGYEIWSRRKQFVMLRLSHDCGRFNAQSYVIAQLVQIGVLKYDSWDCNSLKTIEQPVAHAKFFKFSQTTFDNVQIKDNLNQYHWVPIGDIHVPLFSTQIDRATNTFEVSTPYEFGTDAPSFFKWCTQMIQKKCASEHTSWLSKMSCELGLRLRILRSNKSSEMWIWI